MRKMCLLCRWIVQPSQGARSIPLRNSYSARSSHLFRSPVLTRCSAPLLHSAPVWHFVPAQCPFQVPSPLSVHLRLCPPESMLILDLPGKYEIEKGDSPQQHTIPVRDPQSSKYHSEEQYDSYDDTSLKTHSEQYLHHCHYYHSSLPHYFR